MCERRQRLSADPSGRADAGRRSTSASAFGRVSAWQNRPAKIERGVAVNAFVGGGSFGVVQAGMPHSRYPRHCRGHRCRLDVGSLRLLCWRSPARRNRASRNDLAPIATFVSRRDRGANIGLDGLDGYPVVHATPRFRALALFGRRPQHRVDSVGIPASKNLHKRLHRRPISRKSARRPKQDNSAFRQEAALRPQGKSGMRVLAYC